MLKTILLLIFLMCGSVMAQDVDIVPYLKAIENGRVDEVKQAFTSLKKESPNSPSVLFLEGLLQEDAQKSVTIYNQILNRHPSSRYADAALYRIFSYYFAVGEYSASKTYLNRLKTDYPESPYIKIAEREIPSGRDVENGAPETSPAVNKPQIRIPKAEEFTYTIQAGAFANENNAASLKKEIEEAGQSAEIRSKNVGGTDFKIVLAGKFRSMEEAEDFLQILNKEFKLAGRIVRLDSLK